MEKIKEFFSKNKATIIAVLSAFLTFVISLSDINLGTKVGIVCSILIVIIPFLISVISGADMEVSIKLLVNAITVIQDIIKDAQKVEDVTVVGESRELTEEEIRELITKGL